MDLNRPVTCPGWRPGRDSPAGGLREVPDQPLCLTWAGPAALGGRARPLQQAAQQLGRRAPAPPVAGNPLVFRIGQAGAHDQRE
jgi:hypothetical protein